MSKPVNKAVEDSSRIQQLKIHDRQRRQSCSRYTVGNKAQRVTSKQFVAEMDVKPRSAESSLIPITRAFFPFHCQKLEFRKVGILQSAVLGSSTCHGLRVLAFVCWFKLKDKKWD